MRDAAGNVTQKTDARGQVSTSSYDALNRVTATSFTGAPTFSITYGYDSTAGGNYGIGRLTSVTDVSGQTALKYDHRGNIVAEERNIGGVLYTTSYAYDLADNLVAMTYPSGRIVTYTRDALGRVTAVTTQTDAMAPVVNVATSITYMPFGPIAGLTHGNALAATFTWDQDYRLTGIVTAQGGTTIQDLTYGFNLVDNVTSITDNLASARNQTFTLDDLQRLTAATGIYGSLSYTYDAADNRLTRNLSGGLSETFTYGTTDNRVQSATVTGQPARTFTHDNAGNITIDDRGSGNTVVITIGADGRPQVVTVTGAGATTVTYKHNAFGERVSRIEGAATTHFHYDQDGRLIAETDGTGALIREYLWLGDKPLALVVGPVASATLYFVHADHLERVQKITDATQAIVWDGQFTPYGRTHAIAGTIQNPLRFPGQWADPAAGYFYNYMRDYDPTLARYLSVDPLGTSGGRNRYGYSEGNPQNFVDPYGEAGRALAFAAATVAIDYGLARLTHSGCTPFSYGPERALLAVGLGGLFGVLPRLFGVRALASLRGAMQSLGAPLSGASQGGMGVLSRFLSSEFGGGSLASLFGRGASNLGGPAVVRSRSVLEHIFRPRPGHVNPTTSASRERYIRLFEDVAGNPANLRPPTNPAAAGAGVQFFTQSFRNGQVWVNVIGGRITNAGVNARGLFR